LRQLGYLNGAGLRDNDLQAAADVLVTFKAAYADLIDRYNKSALDANAGSGEPDLSSFQASRDLLVQSTQGTLKSVLTPSGLANLRAYVQREKKNMLVSEEIQ